MNGTIKALARSGTEPPNSRQSRERNVGALNRFYWFDK